jgi:hypothetical protein
MFRTPKKHWLKNILKDLLKLWIIPGFLLRIQIMEDVDLGVRQQEKGENLTLYMVQLKMNYIT